MPTTISCSPRPKAPLQLRLVRLPDHCQPLATDQLLGGRTIGDRDEPILDMCLPVFSAACRLYRWKRRRRQASTTASSETGSQSSAQNSSAGLTYNDTDETETSLAIYQNEDSRIVEKLDCGLLAVRSGSGWYLPRQLLGTEYGSNFAFNVYMDGALSIPHRSAAPSIRMAPPQTAIAPSARSLTVPA